MAEFTGDKTHDPTPHRRQQARDEGQVARSQDVGSAVLLCGGAVALMWLGRPVVDLLSKLAVRQLGGEPWLTADVDFVVSEWTGVLAALAGVLLPILGLMMLLAIGGSVFQTGLLFLPGKVQPDFSRIDPLRGLGRIFSARSSARLGFGVLKLAVVAGVAWYGLAAQWEQILGCGQLPTAALAAFVAETLVWTMLQIGMTLLGLAALDYGYERWKHERDLRMSVQEIREELRSTHGNPQVIARRNALRRLRRQPGESATAAIAPRTPTEHMRL